MDAVYKKLGRKAPQCRTGEVPLPGSAIGTAGDFEEFAAGFKMTSGLTEELADRLLKLYGARAPEVLPRPEKITRCAYRSRLRPRSRPALSGRRSCTLSAARWPRS